MIELAWSSYIYAQLNPNLKLEYRSYVLLWHESAYSIQGGNCEKSNVV